MALSRRKRAPTRRAVQARPVRFDASLNVKVEKRKKAALVKFALSERRSVAFFVQAWLDRWLVENAIVLPTDEEADQILLEAYGG